MANEQATTPRGLWLLVVAAPAIVAAEQQGNTTLLTKLRTDLKLYEQAQCRP